MRVESDETQARIAADRLTADIRSARLAPGVKLKVGELRELYGIGASPLREALLLVSSLGYVTGESHRGYRVAEISGQDLADITEAREVVETGMLRTSMTARDDDWAVGIVAAVERLRRAVAKGPLESDDHTSPVGLAHRQFHSALVAGCSSTRLRQMQELLFDQAGRYRDIMIRKVRGPDHFVRMHEDLAAVVLGTDIDRACEALKIHLNLTPRNVRLALNEAAGLGNGTDIVREARLDAAFD